MNAQYLLVDLLGCRECWGVGGKGLRGGRVVVRWCDDVRAEEMEESNLGVGMACIEGVITMETVGEAVKVEKR